MKSVIFVSRRNAHLECNNVNLPQNYPLLKDVGYIIDFVESKESLELPKSILDGKFWVLVSSQIS